MNELIYAVIGIGGGVLLALFFPIVKGFITGAMSKVVKEKLGVEVQNTYTKQSLLAKIKYDLQPIKILTSSIRTILVCLAIAGVVYGFGFWRGKKGKPVYIDMSDFKATATCTYDKSKKHTLSVKDNKFYFDDIAVTEGDIPSLKPYGVELHPKVFGGFSSKGGAAGAGFEVAHFYKLNLDAFVMSDKAGYIGVSYDLKSNSTKKAMKWFNNSAIGIAAGKSIDNIDETRIMVYWTISL